MVGLFVPQLMVVGRTGKEDHVRSHVAQGKKLREERAQTRNHQKEDNHAEKRSLGLLTVTGSHVSVSEIGRITPTKNFFLNITRPHRSYS